MLSLSLLIPPSHLNLLPEPVEVGLLPVEGGHHPDHVRIVPQELWNLSPKRGFHPCRPVEPLPFEPVSTSIVARISCSCKTLSTKVGMGCHCQGSCSHTKGGLVGRHHHLLSLGAVRPGHGALGQTERGLRLEHQVVGRISEVLGGQSLREWIE